MATQSVILITGCSSGIGAALAEEFHGRGHTVYATARRLESLAPLAARGMRTLALDVTDRDSIAAAAAVLAHEAGRLDMLVNNAGYGQFGAVMDLGADELRRQFDTNVIAPVQVTRAFLSLMLVQRCGRILNVGSVSGILTTPFGGAYCASKAALHALSDAMRMELAPFGIEVVTIQPGAVTSSIGETGSSKAVLPADSIYAPLAERIGNRAQISQQGAMPTRDFARLVATAVFADAAPLVVRGGPHSFRLPFLKRWLPARMIDRRLSKMFGLDGLRRSESAKKGE
jgi:NAD(P)-dependent dehydrogenase (short-subunit alcohol dehydrogenase family)